MGCYNFSYKFVLKVIVYFFLSSLINRTNSTAFQDSFSDYRFTDQMIHADEMLITSVNTARDSLDTLMVKLQLGNSYQYHFFEVSGTYGYRNALISRSIVHDTLINGLQYFKWDDDDRYYRHDKQSNELIWRYGQTESLFCDFDFPSNTVYQLFDPKYNIMGPVRISRSYKNVFGMVRKVFSVIPMGLGPLGQYVYFAEGLGIYLTGGTDRGLTEYSSSIIDAVIYETPWDYTYFHHGYNPEISLTPLPHILLHQIQVYEVMVNHYYNRNNVIYNLPREGIVYIDTVYLEYYNQNDSAINKRKSFSGQKVYLNPKYRINMFLDSALFKVGDTLRYRIVAEDKSLIPTRVFYPQTGFLSTTIQTATSLKDKESKVPESFTLSQNFPNPFNPSTKIKFTIPPLTPSLSKGERVILKVYDILGREVATLVNEELSAGEYEVEFTAGSASNFQQAQGGAGSASTSSAFATNFHSGVYFYTLRVGSFLQNRKMVLMR